tara:strand:- start:361 stop:738 length:378 start_codon:yes stop_codon:yes gene_type:complete
MKKNVPNICRDSEVSHDYSVAFGSLTNYLERVADDDPPRTRHLACRAFLHRVIPKYEEYFPPEEYEDVINSQNGATVDKINSIVEKLNELRSQKISDCEVLQPLRIALVDLISGGDKKSLNKSKG